MKNTQNAICVQKVIIKVSGGSMSGMNMNLIHKFYQLLKFGETKKNFPAGNLQASYCGEPKWGVGEPKHFIFYEKYVD